MSVITLSPTIITSSGATLRYFNTMSNIIVVGFPRTVTFCPAAHWTHSAIAPLPGMEIPGFIKLLGSGSVTKIGLLGYFRVMLIMRVRFWKLKSVERATHMASTLIGSCSVYKL